MVLKKFRDDARAARQWRTIRNVRRGAVRGALESNAPGTISSSLEASRYR
jgi:hypothetical protein